MFYSAFIKARRVFKPTRNEKKERKCYSKSAKTEAKRGQVQHLLSAELLQTYKTWEKNSASCSLSVPREFRRPPRSRRPRLRPRQAGPRPPTARPAVSRHCGTRGAHSRDPAPTCPLCRPGPPCHPPSPGVGSRKRRVKRSALPAALSAPPLVTRPRSPSTPPDAMGAPCPSITAPLSCPCPRSPFASLP
jgi:hypothetical protein